MKYDDFLKTMTGCPFCVAHGREVIFENEHAYLTYALAPYHKDHLLVVPKRHIDNLLDLHHVEIEDIEKLERKGIMILRQLGYKNIALLAREGMVGKSVPHIHYHLIPDTNVGDTEHVGINRDMLDEDQILGVVQRIKTASIEADKRAEEIKNKK